MGTQLWAIGSGKGGDGKTFITSSLGITLSKLQHSVLLVDFDFSGANLHTSLGLPLSEKNIKRYFSKEARLIDVCHPTHIPRLSYIQGFWDSWCSAEISN